MVNVLINPSIIAKEALFQLENNLVMGDKVHREYKDEFVKIGATVTIRRPVKFTVTTGASRTNQDVHEPTTSITIDQRKHVSWTFSAQDLTLTIEEYSERYIKPAMIVLANEVDAALCTEGKNKFFNQVGAPGTTPSSFSDLGDAAQRMDELAIPDDMQRCLVLNPAARWSMADGLGTIFNAEITGDTVRRGRLGEIANFQIYGDQNIANHTIGTYSGTPLVTATAITNTDLAVDGSTTSAIEIDGMTGSVTGAIKKGDILTFGGCNAVNPISKADTGTLAEFVATADADTTAGVVTVLVYPSLNEGGTTSTAAFQNCTALPISNAAVVIAGSSGVTHPVNLAFHKNALALVMVPLELPDSAVFKARADWKGYSIRVVKAYDIEEDEEIIRLDILYGVRDIYPELGVRVAG
jgi:hypothetical protein